MRSTSDSGPAEQDDDCAGIYHKSLLYLVSNALEKQAALFFADGEPLLGMEKFILERGDLFGVPSDPARELASRHSRRTRSGAAQDPT